MNKILEIVNNKPIITIILYLIVGSLLIASIFLPVGVLSEFSVYLTNLCYSSNNCSPNINEYDNNLDNLTKALFAFLIILIIIIVSCGVLVFYNPRAYKQLGYLLIIIDIITFSLAASVMSAVRNLDLEIGTGPILIIVGCIILLVFHLVDLFLQYSGMSRYFKL